MSAENPPTINLAKLPEAPQVSWRTKCGRLVAAATLLAGGVGIGWHESNEPAITGERVTNIEPLAQGGYDNAVIADKALSYVGHWGGDACRDAHMLDNNNQARTVDGYDGGECRTFVNCIIKLVSGGQQNIGWGPDNYFSALQANGQEITSIDALRKGDIVQEGQGAHTYIIFGRHSGNSFDVVDSNLVAYHTVGEHQRTVTLDSNRRAFRLGRIPTPPPTPKLAPKPQPFDASKYKNHIVEWDNGPGKQHTAWLVDDDGKRYWIPDIPTFWCLRDKGIADDGVQPASVLDHLPDTGQRANCIPELNHAEAAPEPLPTIPPIEKPKQTPVKPVTPPPSTTTTSTTRPPTTTTQPRRVILHVYNKVTNGGAMVEDQAPVELTHAPHPYCNGDCIAHTERHTGGTYDAAVCQTHGPYVTNGNNHDASDDHNPGRYESTLYYGVKLADGTYGYTSDVWVSPDQRGGLDLPAC